MPPGTGPSHTQSLTMPLSILPLASRVIASLFPSAASDATFSCSCVTDGTQPRSMAVLHDVSQTRVQRPSDHTGTIVRGNQTARVSSSHVCVSLSYQRRFLGCSHVWVTCARVIASMSYSEDSASQEVCSCSVHRSRSPSLPHDCAPLASNQEGDLMKHALCSAR